ncbi:MAG: DUF6428 family protein [Verrucomicrobiota bacterium]
MKTNELITGLRVAPKNQLIFVDLDGHAVHSGYHLTELKAASFETVDCGGQTNHWTETIVQLWVPSKADDDYMTAAKFLEIFDKVRGTIAIDLDAEIRIECGDEDLFPSNYRTHSILYEHGITRVLLEPPATTCKARDRKVASVPAADTCCAGAPESCCAT